VGTKERARSVVGLLTSLGLAVPAAGSAGCVTTENPAPIFDGGIDARNRPDAPVSSIGNEALIDVRPSPPDVSAIGNEGWVIDTGTDAAGEDAPADEPDSGDDDAGPPD
jgi:hypothetical protein